MRKLFFVGLLLCIPVVWSYFQPHFFHLADFTHVARLVELERGLLDGQLPVRWSENLGYGYGMPQFSFYGPLFYGEALLFRLLQIPPLWAIKLTVTLQVIVSFVALYALGKMLWGEWGGLITGIAGIYAPYRLVDMYVRGAFAELTGMTCFVVTLLAVVWWAKQPNLRKAVLVSVSGASIIISHTLMAVICAPFVLTWLGYWAIAEKRLRGYWHHILIIGLLTIGLSAFFAFPALLEKGYTQADQLTTGFSAYSQHFLYLRQLWQSPWGYGGSIWGPVDDMSFELGKPQIIILGIILVGLGISLVKKQKNSQFGLFLVIGSLFGLSVFLTLLRSQFLWDMVPFMTFIQFPWRFLSITIIFLALLVGSVGQFFPKKIRPVLILILITLIMGSQFAHTQPESYLSNDADLYSGDAAFIQTRMSGIIPDFLPKTAVAPITSVEIKPDERFVVPATIPHAIEVHRSHEFLVSMSSHQSFVFTAHIFDFPGWTLYYDGKKIDHSTNQQGMIQALIPAGDGDHFISGRFEETPIRLGADMITIASLITAIVFLCKKESPRIHS